MKSFESLFEELTAKSLERSPGSETVKWLDAGVHTIGKKIVEEAAEVWMAAEHEGRERTVEEISQLVYHLQVLMIAKGISLADLNQKL
jgi:phosphoribosyl-ATP pyrophosphohydrolase